MKKRKQRLLAKAFQMEGVKPSDHVEVVESLEDLSVGIINSRKLSLQSIIQFHACQEEMYDEQIAVGCAGSEGMECLKKELELTHLAVCKKDIFRIREELTLPHNLPNIQEIIWDSVNVSEIDFKPLEEKLSVQGELQALFLYEGVGEEGVQIYETVIPFSTNMDCQGCSENMFADIAYYVASKEIEVHTDYDGEERVIGLEMVLDLHIKLYCREKESIFWDAYGITEEVVPVAKQACYLTLLQKKQGKEKVSGTIAFNQPELPVGQIIYGDGQAVVEETQLLDNELILKGSIPMQILYRLADDPDGYACTEGALPFEYRMELEKGEGNIICKSQVQLCSPAISDLQTAPADMEKNALPGMIACFVGPEDTLWEIGKRYCVPISQIKQINNLSSDSIRAGDKLLVVRGV